MISFEELHKKAERLYWKVLSAHVNNDEKVSLVIAADKSMPEDFAAWAIALEEIIAHSSDRKANGYHIYYETKQTRKHGLQSVPAQFYFSDNNHLIHFLARHNEFERFANNVQGILHAFPILKMWVAANPRQIIKFQSDWTPLLKVLQYFVSNPRPPLFLRELPIEVHTKFIELHKGILYELLNMVLPENAICREFEGVAQFEKRFGLRIPPQRIRIRMLDAAFAAAYTGGYSDMELNVDEWANANMPLKQAIVLENKKNFENADIFLSLPYMQATAVIFGSGKAVSLLGQLPWLSNIPILYWGDMDAEGYEILHQIRTLFPNTISFCMSQQSFETFNQFVGTGTGATAKPLLLLTPPEMEMYKKICLNNNRLEQERISHTHVLEQLNSLSICEPFSRTGCI